MFRWLRARWVHPDGVPPRLMPNLQLQLQVRHGEYAGEFNTRIEEIAGDRFLVAIPQQKGMAIPLREGTALSARFLDPSSVYEFHTEVVERVRSPYLALALRLPRSRDINRVLTRSWPRYAVSLTILFRIVDSPDTYHPETHHRTRTTDLSCGGAAFEYAEQIPAQSRLRLELHLPDDDPPVSLDARVVRGERRPGEKRETWAYGVEFLNMSEETRRRIAGALRPSAGEARND